MSGSETGLMMSSHPQQQQHHHQPQPPVIQNMRLAYTADGNSVYEPLDESGAAAVHPHGLGSNLSGEAMKRKRGRPRKYGPDGGVSLALSPTSSAGGVAGGAFSSHPVQQQMPAAQPASGGSLSPSSLGMGKKGRGRPPGSSSKKHQQPVVVEEAAGSSMGSVAIGFTPHVITVQAGEDVASRIMAFSQVGPRAVCILSANGAISNVTLRQAASSGGTVTYEGRFEILSLSGSFMLSECAGQRSRIGGLSISLAGPDGRVLGGGVAGVLTAASAVQVVVGSFMAEGQKNMKSMRQNHQFHPHHQVDSISMPERGVVRAVTAMGPGSPTSRGTLSESSESPMNLSNNSAPPHSQPAMLGILPWK